LGCQNIDYRHHYAQASEDAQDGSRDPSVQFAQALGFMAVKLNANYDSRSGRDLVLQEVGDTQEQVFSDLVRGMAEVLMLFDK
jgi:hypothetical protein